MNTHLRFCAVLRALVLIALALGMTAPVAAQTTGTLITGTVLDAASALPISGARLTANGPSGSNVTADRNGKFSITGLTAGFYTLTARADGYQPAQSDQITVLAGQSASVTLTLQRVTTNASLRVIGRTATTTTASLQRASVLYQQVNPEEAIAQGQYRLGDALRELPGIVNGGADTAAPADDLSLNFRGIGALETLSLVDGHPVGYGLQTPFNFDSTPPGIYRSVLAVYGSGADQLYPLNSIGGVFDFQTINPTPKFQASFTQQIGTFSQKLSLLSLTGTQSGIGYAFATSAQGTDGPFNHVRLYNYSAAQDPGATDALRNGAFYDDFSGSTAHTLLGKLVLPVAKDTKLTLNALTESFYDDKTGNGDNDYTPYSVALGNAQGNLGTAYPIYYNAGSAGAPQYVQDPGSDGNGATATCPSNLVPLLNGSGIPSGTYTQNVIGSRGAASKNATQVPNAACVTPQQYAGVNSGWNGAGPAFQTYNLQDYHMRLEQSNEKHDVFVDAYVDNYLHHYDRDLQLPYFNAPGDNPGSDYEGVVNSGLTVANTFSDAHNSTGFGVYYNNAAYSFVSNGSGSNNAAAFSDFSAFLRQAYTFPTTPLTLYGNLWVKNAGETNASYVDPRAAAVYNLRNDSFRVSYGETTTQPYIAAIVQPFSPRSLGSINGNITTSQCPSAATSPFSIGSGGSGKGLKAERGIDEELQYGHRFFGDSIVQATFYNTNVYNKIYNTVSPLSIAGVGGISPTFLNAAFGVIRGICGQSFDVASGIGISAATNLAHVRAQGIELTGRQRIVRPVYFDYDYATNAVQLVSAPAALVSKNSALIPGSQLPNVPLHQYNIGLNYEFVRGADARISYHHVSVNNTKNLGPYGFADLLVESAVGPGRLSIGVSNLFNNVNTFYEGNENLGVPLATNSYAAGVPIPREQFGLPFRQIDFTYTLTTR